MKHEIPTVPQQAPHREQGYSPEQAYARAFNEQNHLKHTPFEAKPKQPTPQTAKK